MLDLFKSFLLVFSTEMGDKTQLLALLLVARFKKPWTIMLAIGFATILNHGLAALVGKHLGKSLMESSYFPYIMAAVFLGFAIWVLIPDKSKDEKSGKFNKSVFWTTAVSFFLAEMGDKTQLATLALGAQIQNVYIVTFGTTLGMLAADGLAVALGQAFLKKIPLKHIRLAAAFIYVVLAIAVLL